MSELTPSDIVRRQHSRTLNRRVKQFPAVREQDETPKSSHNQEFNYDPELGLLSFDHRTVTVGKRLSETGADENVFYGNATHEDIACRLLGGEQVGGGPWLSPWPDRTEPKDFDNQIYIALNETRYAQSLPRYPAVRFGVVNGGPFYHFGIGFRFKEKSFDLDAGIAEGRNTFQASSILKVEPESPYQFRGYNFVEEIGVPVFYVNPESTITNRQDQLWPFQLRISTEDYVVEKRKYTLRPSFGSFAEKLIGGSNKVDDDINLAAKLLNGLWRNNTMIVESYWDNNLSQVENAMKKLELVEFLLNIYGKWFTFVTRPVTDVPPHIVFLESDFAGMHYERTNDRYPNSVKMVDTLEKDASTQAIAEILGTSLHAQSNKCVNPIEFYNELNSQIAKLF